MRRTILILLSVFCIAIQGIWAQNTIDFTVAKDTVLCLERMVERIDTIVLNRSELNVQSVRTANIIMNDSVLMFGAMDGALYSIGDGRRIRPFCEPAFNIAQFSGEPAIHPGSAWLDSSGRFCYARGNAIVGGERINFIKTLNFCTGEVLDSIPICYIDFALSHDDSLRLATGNNYLTCFPEYKFVLPKDARIGSIRYYGGLKMWVKLYIKGKIEDYICNTDGTEMERVEWLAYQGKKIESNMMIGFSQNKLASVLSTDAEFFIFVYQLKNRRR